MTRCEKANRQTRAQVVVTCGCVKFKDTIIESHPISLPPESISILIIITNSNKMFVSTFLKHST